MRHAILAIAIGMFIGLPVSGSDLHAQERAPYMTVTGEGRVKAVPDIVEITLGVETTEPLASAALAGNAAAMNQIFDVLGVVGISEEDIQTGSVSLSPRYEERQRNEPRPLEIIGYVARTDLRVRVRDVPLLGRVLDDLTLAGVNRINGIAFALGDPRPMMDLARRDAVADARAKAELYAGAAGVSLGAVLSIQEANTAAGPRPMMMAEARSMEFDMPIAPGELTVAANVTITYALEQ